MLSTVNAKPSEDSDNASEEEEEEEEEAGEEEGSEEAERTLVTREVETREMSGGLGESAMSHGRERRRREERRKKKGERGR